MAKQTLYDMVLACIKQRAGQRFTAKELARKLYEDYPDEGQAKIARSSKLENEDELVQQYAAEISARALQQKYPEIKVTEGRPRKYYYTDLTDTQEVEQAESVPTSSDKKEKDLYKPLSDYLKDELGVYSLRIDEKHSTNAQGPGGNRWLYPDIVGMEDVAGIGQRM